VRDGSQGTPPRFIVSEIDGYPIGGHYGRRPQMMLSVSVLDRGWGYAEVARWNEEDEIAKRAGNYRSKRERREAMRNRAHGLAAMLEAQHAT
jgi:hypothetical protein